ADSRSKRSGRETRRSTDERGCWRVWAKPDADSPTNPSRGQPARANHMKFVMTAHTRQREPWTVPQTHKERCVQMTPDYFSPDNVLVVSFGEEPENDENA